nr:LOW QUALITY PROTEIN: protein atonal homolog 8 [Chelonoidis abingdonii]
MGAQVHSPSNAANAARDFSLEILMLQGMRPTRAGLCRAALLTAEEEPGGGGEARVDAGTRGGRTSLSRFQQSEKHALLAEEPWQAVLVKESGSLKKLKRKAQSATPANAATKVFQVGAESRAASGQAGEPRGWTPDPSCALGEAWASFTGGGASHAAPGRQRGSGAPRSVACMDNAERRLPGGGGGPGSGGPPAPPPAAVNGLPPCPGEQRLASRLVLCPPPPQRPLGSAYASAAHGAYSSTPGPAASPRKRLGEPAGVASEIKAIQQTRRLLANARERTRVHTISAAFEALRKQVPCYSYGQKLSKLAILRIACNYILSLARLADMDYSADHSNMSFSECVEQCTRTLQAEGRSKKRKE